MKILCHSGFVLQRNNFILRVGSAALRNCGAAPRYQSQDITSISALASEPNMRNNRHRENLPLYDCKGKFLRYIDHASGDALTQSGDVEAVRKFQNGSERAVAYRETRESKSPTRGNMQSLFS